MSGQLYAAFGTGMFFMAVLLAIACFIAFRPNPAPVPKEAMLIFRVILALAGAAFAVILTGFLDLVGQFGGWKLRTGGGLAVFITLYLINPPDLIRQTSAAPRKAVRIKIPSEKTEIGSKDKEK